MRGYNGYYWKQDSKQQSKGKEEEKVAVDRDNFIDGTDGSDDDENTNGGIGHAMEASVYHRWIASVIEITASS